VQVESGAFDLNKRSESAKHMLGSRSTRFKHDVSVTEIELLMNFRPHNPSYTVQSLILMMRRGVRVKVHTRDT